MLHSFNLNFGQIPWVAMFTSRVHQEIGVILFVGRGGVLLFFSSLPRTPFVLFLSTHLSSALDPSLMDLIVNLR